MSVWENLSNIDSIINYIKSNSVEHILEEVSLSYNVTPTQLFHNPMGGYSKGKTSGSYFYVLQDLKSNLDSYEWLYNRLFDDKSKEIYLNLLRYRLTASIQFIKNAFDGYNPQYFDKSIVECDENEVFVDCGAFTGDTVESYIKNYGKYKKIYCYEPSPDNVAKCIENTNEYDNVVINQSGVGESNKTCYFTSTGASSSVTNDENLDSINIVSIDEDIKEKITFLKMDVECEEINAILGAKTHILEDTPKLAICLYHIVSDLWEIPKLIDSINPNYKFYIRHYEPNVAWETVLYAIPKV